MTATIIQSVWYQIGKPIVACQQKVSKIAQNFNALTILEIVRALKFNPTRHEITMSYNDCVCICFMAKMRSEIFLRFIVLY